VAAEPGHTPSRGSVSPLRGRDLLLEGLDRLKKVEFVEMATAIASGSRMGPGDGWFHPSQSRYSWKWLADRYDTNRDARITAKEFSGPERLFDRLDRNGDGSIKADDFNWTSLSPFVRQAMIAAQAFSMFDSGSNGRITREEWDALFRSMARGRDFITPDDLREQLFPPEPERPGGGESGPSMPVLFKGLLSGELGSPFEGPRVGARAPLFKLPAPDGKKAIALADLRGKPVVLVFGSFT
jgi:hypothetical protein